MSLIDRRFQLADDAGGLGLHCTPHGVTLAGAPLLRTTVAGLAPRPRKDLGELLRAAYGRDLDPDAVASGLTVVAKALNNGDLGRAMIASVRLRLPSLDVAGAERLAAVEEALTKAAYEHEPRDWHGRWTTGGGAGAKPPKAHPTHSQRRAPRGPIAVAPSNRPASAAPTRTVALQTAAAGVPPRAAVWDAFKELHPNFQSQFDDLGPVEFSKRVIKFAEWIETQAHDNSPMDRAAAKAEYYFLQTRLEYWLGSQYIAPGTHLNLISAASRLFQGATNARLVRQGDPDSFPKSFAATAGLAMVLDGSAMGRGTPVRAVIPEAFKEVDTRMPWLAERLSGIGGLVHNSVVKIPWDKGIAEQGAAWQDYVASRLASRYIHTVDSKGVDHYDPDLEDGINSKTLNTATPYYTFTPSNIYKSLSKYITSLAKYVPGVYTRDWDVPPEKIQTRQIYLAVPEETSPEQWTQIVRAQQLAESKGIKLNVTRVRSNGN